MSPLVGDESEESSENIFESFDNIDVFEQYKEILVDDEDEV